MQTKILNNYIRLVLDRSALTGPVNRREVAEEVYRMAKETDWSLADRREALIDKLIAGVTEEMNTPMSEKYLQEHLPEFPREHLHLLADMPTYIPVNQRLGHHVLAIRATKEDWAAASRIKRSIGKRVIHHADIAEDIRKALEDAGVDSLEELSLERKAA